MSKELQWAIGGLALLILGFVAFQIYLHVDMKRFIEELADPEPNTETEEPTEQVQVPEVDNRPPQPDDGREYEWHGDHWHEVPIAQKEPMPLPEGSLTFHEELLKTNPAKALRLLAEERGYVNAKWIPPFPPDDTEAQEFAKAVYADIYNRSNPPQKILDAGNSSMMLREINKKYPRTSARSNDLKRLIWADLDFSMGEYNLPSDYFPEQLVEVKRSRR